MDEERLEQELQAFLESEVKKAEPSSEWWNNAISRLDEKRQDSRPVRTNFWKLRPSLITIPLSIFLLVILVGGLIGSMGGMAPPPPSAPAMVSDEAGGSFLVWLDKPYHQAESVIYVQRVDAAGNLLWGENGKRIADGNPGVPYATGDGEGGIIVAWGSSGSIQITRLSPDGETIWNLENITSWSVMDIVEDGFGGAILLLYDRINSVYAQRVNNEGELLWGENGVFLGNTQEVGRGKSLISDGAGGAVVIWQKQSAMDMEISAQRLNAEGVAQWGDNGIIVTSREGSQGNNRDIINDGIGNFIIAWDTGGLTPDTDIYIQKLDGNGNFLWGDEGILVCEDQQGESFGLGNMQSHPRIVVDGTGGVIVTWHDRRRIMNREIFAQRISADGETLWAENGVWVWDIPADYYMTANGILDGTITSDGAGGAVIAWTGYKESYNKGSVIYAQRLSPDGQLLWANDEVYGTSPFQSQGYANIVSDGQGGIIIGTRVGESKQISHTNSIYTQRIDSEGNRVWGDSGLEIRKVATAPTLVIITL
ncbi:MAG TPA: hypothetical protein ENN57_02660, partial [Chloroflexi bacterium]|nr:hypothetical protein [Chloroflexota bacterium]